MREEVRAQHVARVRVRGAGEPAVLVQRLRPYEARRPLIRLIADFSAWLSRASAAVECAIIVITAHRSARKHF